MIGPGGGSSGSGHKDRKKKLKIMHFKVLVSLSEEVIKFCAE
jgi:hypothetical protein